MITAVIHQPDFLPWLGFFDRLLHADLFVVLDNVQFTNGSSRSWTYRDKIKTANGEKWISVGLSKCHRETKINEVSTNNSLWNANMRNQIKESYRKAKYFEEIFPYIEELLSSQYEKLVDVNLCSIQLLLELLDIRVEKVMASSLQATGKSNELLVNILKEVGADCYLSGLGAKDYFRGEPFREAGIQVIWQEFKHPHYEQLFGDFVPYLSSIDLLFNCGIAASRKIIRGEQI